MREDSTLLRKIEDKMHFIPNTATLKNFLNRFVGHNSEIILFDAKKDLENRVEAIKKGERDYKLEFLWKGMDWQATDSERDYFKTHPDVKPCPYINSRVVRVFPYDTDMVPILGIEIEVDEDRKK